MTAFRLKIWQIEQTCIFDLTWGQNWSQQLTVKLPYLSTLAPLYQTWRQAYLNFYQSGVRARVEISGTATAPAIDWRARLVQAEAQLLAEFHYWLGQAELLPLRQAIARAASASKQAATPVDLFVTCDSDELARLPWEAWELGTEFATPQPIRIARTPTTIRAEAGQRLRSGKMRILAILGDETGLSFATEQAALRSLRAVATVEFVGWRSGCSSARLKEQIQQQIADEQGWDILFFAGHSNETEITGGELAIAPGVSILMQEIAPQLAIAKARGLQFALFNSCNGLSIAQTLINLGLSQVAVMREPIHNQVAQEFLLRFLQALAAYQDSHEALLTACQFLKLERNLTYPSASLIPSLFRHPDSVPFQLKPFGWRAALKQWLPTRREAIALTLLTAVSLLPPVQQSLLDQRVLLQARYRQWTGQMGTPATPPLLMVQIDEASLRKDGISNANPFPRDYLAKLVRQLSALKAQVVGIDFQLDRPHAEDPQLKQALQTAIQRHHTWFVLVGRQSQTGEWLMVTPEVASPTWSLQGDSWVPFWYVKPLPWLDSTPQPFSYLLATAYRLQHQAPGAASPPYPSLDNPQELATQLNLYSRQQPAATRNPLITEAMQLHPITALSYALQQRWLQPILDFSIPPSQVFDTIPAWQLLQQPQQVLQSHKLTDLHTQLVMIAAGGYSEAGANFEGEDNFPLPPAIAYWRSQQQPPDENRVLPGGEAHAYMTHHFLTQRFVIPIPDLWMVLLTIPLGKALALYGSRGHKQRRVWLPLGITLGYGVLSLQAYLTAAVLLPWLLPTATLGMYVLSTGKREHHG